MIHKIVLNNLKTYNEIIIYGAGNNGIFAADYLKSCGISVNAFVDADIRKQGTVIRNIKCLGVEDVFPQDGTCLIISPLSENKALVKKMKQLGFQNIYSWDEIKYFIRMDGKLKKRYLEEYVEESKLLKLNKRYKDMYSGKRCFILGTGPSISKQNLQLLKDEYVFTVNQFSRLPQFADVMTNFHVWNDSGYFLYENDESVMYDRIETMKKVGNKAICFFPYNKAYEFVKKYNLEKVLQINYYHEHEQIEIFKENLDITSLLPEVGTVVLTAVNIAFYMGFSEIYLLGCDCTDILTVISSKNKTLAKIEYSYPENDNVKNQVKNMLADRPLEYIYAMQAKKFEAFRLLGEICGESGVYLANCTEGGILEGIPRMKYESLF